MAVGGRKGHLAIVDMMNLSLIRELQVYLINVDLPFVWFYYMFNFIFFTGDTRHAFFRWDHIVLLIFRSYYFLATAKHLNKNFTLRFI